MFEIEDDDFMPSSSANLSSIFNNTVLSDDGATSLSYKAPKQPKGVGSAGASKSDKIPEKTPTQSSVILAKVITLWKLENGQNKLLGKHIVAIIGNPGQQLYELIVYKEKTNILFRQSLNESLTLYKYAKNFMGIYDSYRQFWNLGFDNSENQESFLKEISIHKCQIIEQESQTNNNDQVDSRIENISASIGDDKPEEAPNSEQLINGQSHTDNNNAKDKILSRITKMGRQILPKADIMERKISTDSETESNYSYPKSTKPTTVPRKFRRNPNPTDKALTTPIMPERSSYAPNTNQILLSHNQMVLNPHSMVYSQQCPDYGMNSYIIAQNAELKANLSEINLKLNSVLSSHSGGVDKNGNTGGSDDLKSQIKCLNLRIENLTKDLERSRQALEDFRNKYDLKCSEMLEERARWVDLPEELDRLRKELHHMEALRVQNEQLNAIVNEKNHQLLEAKELNLKESEAYLVEKQRLKGNFEKQVEELNSKIDILTLKTTEYEEKLTQKESMLNELQKNDLRIDKVDKKVRETMNETFRTIMERFEENEDYGFMDIQKVVLETLKKSTFSLIHSLE